MFADEKSTIGSEKMTLPAGLDTCVDSMIILVSNSSLSAVHEEVTGMAFYGHPSYELMQTFRQQTIRSIRRSSFS